MKSLSFIVLIALVFPFFSKAQIKPTDNKPNIKLKKVVDITAPKLKLVSQSALKDGKIVVIKNKKSGKHLKK